MLTRGRRRGAAPAVAVLLLAATGASGCSLQKLATRKLGSALAGSGGVYAADDDPELVGAALPFALKTMEGLLAQDPGNGDLLLAASSGFTQYAWGWVQLPARRLQEEDWAESQRQLARARQLYLRARGYGMRGLELSHPGIGERLRREPEAAVAELGRDDLPLAFWTGAALGGAIALGKDQPELLGELPAAQALVGRVLAVDETWAGGAAHEVSISLAAALPAAMGGGAGRARQHFDRAVAIAGGRHAAPYLALAEGVAVPAQDRAAFDELLRQALAVDADAEPPARVANLLAQRHAEWLLENAGIWFLDESLEDEGALGDEPAETDPQQEPPADAGEQP
jgi:hypothetical protein